MATLAAQDLRLVGPGNTALNTGCYDGVRHRSILLDDGQRTFEWDGSHWLVRTFEGPPADAAQLVFATQLGRTLALVPDVFAPPMQSWSYDGHSWVQLATAGSPSYRTGAMLCWDDVHACAVLFGGQDYWSNQVVDETWTFDGQTWTQHSPTARPTARTYAAMACDTARQRCVLFGGFDQVSGFVQDTWEWDGTNWLQRSPASPPPPTLHAGMTYDPVRQRIVMFGGSGNTPTGTYEYDGTNWALRTATGPVPSMRTAHTLAFDTALGEVVTFGGFGHTNGVSAPADDLWSWNGVRWQLRSARGRQPSWRVGAALIGATYGTNTLLFGGAVDVAVHADTWSWNGTNWSELPVTGPPGRAHAAACTTPSGAILFGGATGNGSTPILGDTWIWNGSAWNAIAGPGPSPRSDASLCFDLTHNRAVLFGGWANGNLSDTWTFDGTSWQQESPANSPPARAGHALACDLVRGDVVLFGGFANSLQPLQDTWVWNGSDWNQLTPAHVPPALGYASMDFDASRQRLVLMQGPLFGGATDIWSFDGADWAPIQVVHPQPFVYGARVAAAPNGIGVVFHDYGHLYELAGQPAQAEPYGTACGVAAPMLSANTWPELGAPFGLDSAGNDPNALVAFVGATAAANLPVGGCTLLVAPGQAVTLVASGPQGFAHQPVPLPNAPALRGVRLYFQAASLRPTAPSGFVLSAGLAVTIGD